MYSRPGLSFCATRFIGGCGIEELGGRFHGTSTSSWLERLFKPLKEENQMSDEQKIETTEEEAEVEGHGNHPRADFDEGNHPRAPEEEAEVAGHLFITDAAGRRGNVHGRRGPASGG